MNLTSEEIEHLRTVRRWMRRVYLGSVENKPLDGIERDALDDAMKALDPIIAKLDGVRPVDDPYEPLLCGRSEERAFWKELGYDQ